MQPCIQKPFGDSLLHVCRFNVIIPMQYSHPPHNLNYKINLWSLSFHGDATDAVLDSIWYLPRNKCHYTSNRINSTEPQRNSEEKIDPKHNRRPGSEKKKRNGDILQTCSSVNTLTYDIHGQDNRLNAGQQSNTSSFTLHWIPILLDYFTVMGSSLFLFNPWGVGGVDLSFPFVFHVSPSFVDTRNLPEGL